VAQVLTIRPANDAAALELASWCGALLPSVSRSAHTLAADLASARATRLNVDANLAGSGCVIFYGHGKDSELVGSGGIALVDALNVGSCAQAIVVAVACNSAKVLGPFGVSNGVAAFR